jgi:hypothetical protein
VKRYFRLALLDIRIGTFLVFSGIFLMIKALVPILPFGDHFNLHFIINKVAFFYMDSESTKKQ